MSITSSLFRKAVKVLRRGSKPAVRVAAVESADAPRFSMLESLESRLLMSVVTVETQSSATEGGANGVIRVTRDDAMGDLTVRFSATGGSGLGATREFTLNDGVNNLTNSVVIPDGATFVDINLVANDDAIAEPTETVTFTLRTGTGYTLSPDFSTRSDTATITDNEPIVTIAATDAVSAESGTPATDTGTFTITRAGNTTGDLTVSFSISGSARRNTDYLITSGGNPVTSSVVIPDGVASVVIDVAPIDDTRYEPTEAVVLTLRSTTRYTLGAVKAASVIINENEPLVFFDPTATAPASFSITTSDGIGADSYVQDGAESDEAHDDLPMEVRNAEGLIGFDSRKAYVSPDLAAIPFSTFSNAILTLTLIDVEGDSPNNTNFTFNVYGLKDDHMPVGNEQGDDWAEDITYLDAPGNATPGDQVELGDMFGGGPIGSFSIVGTGVIGQTVSITGQLLTDYLNSETTLDADGDTFVTFVIVRVNVGDPQLDTVIHKFDSRDDAFGDASTEPTLTVFGEVLGLTVDEDDTTSIRVFREGNTVGDLTVNFTASGPARLGVDYTLEVDGNPVTSSFVIPDGEDFVDIQVIPIDDSIFEIDEALTLTIRTSTTHTTDSINRSVTVNIVDDEPVVTVVATDDDAQEPSVTTTSLDRGTFTIIRTGSVAEDLAVKIRFTGTAREGTDFATVGRTVIIPAGQASVSVNIDPLADTIPEGIEEVRLEIVESTTYGLTWTVNGSRPQTGNQIRPTLLNAANIKQARQAAKNLNISGPTLTRTAQADSVFIANGNPALAPDLVGLLYQLLGADLDNDAVAGSLGTVTIRNQGRTGVGAFNVRFLLSTDKIADGMDFELGEQTVLGLSDGKSTKVTIIHGDLAALAAGDYYLIAQIDSDSFVLEAIEDNNEFVSTNPITVVD